MPGVINPESTMEPCADCQRSELQVHKAASSGHLDCLKHVLANLENPELLLDDDFHTPMHAAASSGHPEILKYLIENTRIPVRAKSKTGETCAHLAAQRGRLDCLKMLLSGPLKRAQSLAFEKDELGCSLLHSAVMVNDNDIALWLLQRFGKAIANLANHDDLLPLHVASAQGNIEFIRIATKYDIYMVNRRDRNGATPAFYAVQGGYLQCLKYLVDKARADVHAVTRKGQSLLHAACLNGHVLIVQWLLGKMERNALLSQTNDAATPIHCASFGGHVGILKLLYKSCGNKKHFTNGTDRRGNTTPLHLAALNNHLHCAKFLIDLGAEPKSKNKIAHTPIEIAEQKGHRQMAALLLASLRGRKELKRYMKESGFYGMVPDKRRTKSVSTSGCSTSVPPPSRDGFSCYSKIALPIGAIPGRVSMVPEPSSGYGSSNETVHNFITSAGPDPGNHLVNWRGRLAGVHETQNSLALSRENWLLKKKPHKQTDVSQKRRDGKQANPKNNSQDARERNRKKSEEKVKIAPDRTRRLVDCAMQTDPDPLMEHIIVVDNEETVVWSSDENRKTSVQPTAAAAIVHATQEADQNSGVILLGSDSDEKEHDSEGTLDRNPTSLDKAVLSGQPPRLLKVRYAPTPSPIAEKREKHGKQEKQDLRSPEKRVVYSSVTKKSQLLSAHSSEKEESQKNFDREVKYAGIAAASEIDKILDGEVDIEHEEDGVETLIADIPSPQETLVGDIACKPVQSPHKGTDLTGRPISPPFIYDPTEGTIEKVRRSSGDTQATLDELRESSDTLSNVDKVGKKPEFSSNESLMPPTRNDQKSPSFLSSAKSISLSDVSKNSTLDSLTNGRELKEEGEVVSKSMDDLRPISRSSTLYDGNPTPESSGFYGPEAYAEENLWKAPLRQQNPIGYYPRLRSAATPPSFGGAREVINRRRMDPSTGNLHGISTEEKELCGSKVTQMLQKFETRENSSDESIDVTPPPLPPNPPPNYWKKLERTGAAESEGEEAEESNFRFFGMTNASDKDLRSKLYDMIVPSHPS